MPEQEFGSDGQLHDTEKPGEQPYGHAPGFTQPVDPFEASEPASAAQRQRAFEDEHLGEDAPRISGKVERGHGSLFQRLPPGKQKAHTALEKAAETEQKVAEAKAALAAAEAEHKAASEDASRLGSG